jgi:hypothetical protein
MSWYRTVPRSYAQDFLVLKFDIEKEKIKEINLKRTNAQIFSDDYKINATQMSGIMEALKNSTIVKSFNITSLIFLF